MTKEETKKAIEVMQAYVDGKQIQFYNPVKEIWEDLNECDDPYWEWNGTAYRIKPEKKVRPYTFDELCEAVKKHGTMTKSKYEKSAFSIVYFNNDRIRFCEDCDESYSEFYNNNVWFDDNSPCGIIEEE